MIGVAKAQVVASAAGDTEKHEKLCAQETGLLDRMDKLLNDPDLPESERKEWIKEMDRKLSPWME